MFLGVKLSRQSPDHSFSSGKGAQLDHLIQLISDKYVDTLDEAILYRGGIDGILKNLDPHTVYIPANELVRANEELEGSFYGIGIEFYLLHDTVTVTAILPEGPSEKANIQPGDKILRIDDSLIAGKQLDEDDIIRRIRGQRNTKLKLTLLRLDKTTPVVELSRGVLPLKSVTASFKMNTETGYIKIEMFSETTYDEFREALENLVKEGIKKLIIDVRDNPGGYMDAVANVADELIAGRHTIVSTKGKQKSDSLMTSKVGLFEQGPICILVDENSASASEILAGAIQDLDRGTLVGRRTFGKGLVQEQFELPDHAAIRITTARYYLPSGRCIQRSFASGKEQYRHEIIDRFTKGESIREDSIHRKAKKYYTSKKRVVYGDEGVTPDVTAPLDTTYDNRLDAFYIEHLAEQFAQQYYFFNKQDFTRYKTLDQFTAGFSIDTKIRSEMSSFLTHHNIKKDLVDNDNVSVEINSSIRAQFARLLFGNNGKFKELLTADPFIILALATLK